MKKMKNTPQRKKTTQNNTKYFGVEENCLPPHIHRKMQGEIPILKGPRTLRMHHKKALMNNKSAQKRGNEKHQKLKMYLD